MKTCCGHCGEYSNNQPAGDGCHNCQKGVMIALACCDYCGKVLTKFNRGRFVGYCDICEKLAE